MKGKTNVLVMAKCDEDVRSALHDRFDDSCDFWFREDKKSVPDEQLRLAEVIIGEPEEDELLKAENLKWMQLTWAGANKYTRMKSFSPEICLTNASGAFGKIIAEYVVGGIIALYRSFHKYRDNQREHVWKRVDPAVSVCGKKALILGTGDIGSNVAKRLKAFDAHIIGMRRKITEEMPEHFDEVCSITSLDEVLPEADIVVGCLPDTPETAGLLASERLNSMKKQAVLINVGRGSLIKNDDLISVMQNGRLLGAALDVMEGEPLSADSPLWDMDNVIITPHIAGPSFGGNLEIEHHIWDMCMTNLEKYINGEKLDNIVDIKAGY